MWPGETPTFKPEVNGKCTTALHSNTSSKLPSHRAKRGTTQVMPRLPLTTWRTRHCSCAERDAHPGSWPTHTSARVRLPPPLQWPEDTATRLSSGMSRWSRSPCPWTETQTESTED